VWAAFPGQRGLQAVVFGVGFFFQLQVLPEDSFPKKEWDFLCI